MTREERLIGKEELQRLELALSTFTRQNLRGIDIYIEYNIFEEKAPVRFTVNWSSMGSKDAEDAINYGECLVEAGKIARRLNNRNFVRSCDLEEKKLTKKEHVNEVNEMINLYCY